MEHDPKAPEVIFEGDDLLEPPRWPKVVGTISIAWGALNLACGGCFLALGAMTSSLVQGAEQQMGPMPDVMKPSGLQMGVGILGLIPTVLLLAAGILVVARKPAGKMLHVVYGVLALLTTAAGVLIGLQQQLAVVEWVRQNPDNAWAKQAKPAVGFVIMGIMVTLGLVWPVFCIIWFGAVKRNAPMDIPREDVI